MKELKVCFCGGGTGGHLNPLIACYLELPSQARAASYFLLPEAPLEKELGDKHDLNVRFFRFSGMLRGNLLSKVFKILGNFAGSLRVLLRKRPDVVIGSGGYTSFPVYLAAVLLRIPLVILEPNLTAGKVNRWFACHSSLFFGKSRELLEDLEGKSVKFEDLPIFPSLAFRNLEARSEDPVVIKPRVLVFGASQGARAINEFTREFLTQNPEFQENFHWISGLSHYEELKDQFPDSNLEPYCHEMARAYQSCDLVICRSGAGTVNEVSFFQSPAVFVPYPYHADRQQFLNCADLVKKGACVLWEESDLPEKLAELKGMLESPQIFEKMKSQFPERQDFEPARFVLEKIVHRIPSGGGENS